MMTPEQKAAYINAQAACALAEIQGMVAENQQRIGNGYSIAYDEVSFDGVAEKYGITHNQVCSFFE